MAPCFSQIKNASPPLGGHLDHVSTAPQDVLRKQAHWIAVLDQVRYKPKYDLRFA